MKGANILVTDSGVVKLADFGCSTSFEGTDSVTEAAKRKQLGTFRFMAPEAIRYATEHVGRKSDIWSLGCVMVEMLTGEKPWPNMSHPGPLMFKVGAEGQRPPLKDDTFLSPACASFLDCCFFVDPDERWSAQDLRMHKFLHVHRNSLVSASTETLSRGNSVEGDVENDVLATKSMTVPRSSYVVSPVKVPGPDAHRVHKNVERETTRVFLTNPGGGW